MKKGEIIKTTLSRWFLLNVENMTYLCPDCGNPVEDIEKACSYCGCPITEMKTTVLICPECKKEIPNSADRCPNCGYPIPKVEVTQRQQFRVINVETTKQHRSTSKIKYMRNGLIAVVAVVAISFVAVVLLVKLNKVTKTIESATYEDAVYCDEATSISACETTEGEDITISNNCKTSGHVKGEWRPIKEATLSEIGIEEILCSVCGESLDIRGIEKKNVKIEGKAFNFKDDEFIEWVNSWDKNYEINPKELGMSKLSAINTSYEITLYSTGSTGILILNHNNSENITGIMAYFENNVEAVAFISSIAENIESEFSIDTAGEMLFDNEMAYSVGRLVMMRTNLSDGFEVTLLTPFDYMGEILTGSSLTINDCIVDVEKNCDELAEYNFNILKYLSDTQNDVYYFWYGDDIPEEDEMGDVFTFRGLLLGEATEETVEKLYGLGDVRHFDKKTDVFYNGLIRMNWEGHQYLADSQKAIVYTYKNIYQIVFYVDVSGIIDFVLFSEGVHY